MSKYTFLASLQAPEYSGRPVELPRLDMRADADTLNRQTAMFDGTLPAALLDSVLSYVLVLNKTRQVIYANRKFLDFLNVRDIKDVAGMRPGEALGCEGSHEGHDGCGTSEVCMRCGALRTILEGFTSGQSSHEVRILRQGPQGMEAFDFRVSGTSLTLNGEDFLIFAIDDISNEKRRRILERIFFHDLMNTVGGLRNLVELLRDDLPKEQRKIAQIVYDVFRNMVDEIETQKLLLAAETGDLTASVQDVSSRDLLLSVKNGFERHDAAQGKELRIAEDSATVCMETDDALVRRVLGNMIKNALEAEPAGSVVTIGCAYERETDEVLLYVHNPSSMPGEVRLQIFQRSFSTKGSDRGIGTYSIKLLAERYLGGTVWFTSTPEEGTTFYARWPRVFQVSAPENLG
ncbi:histidine kinase [Oceanidesulfovibrio indonesiensis]|uniref:Histidine kinase n=1 Tax=Oceanidesulfovibrio indonesiensis TaxID=54767 RepID=A0A7M3MHV6_9BACT|nr:HAMP domain-containing sensor histidine kinase [Oceanidesulfovibrio indonesiensis]TVM18783.1 histidine kinase [Oceanidesulfovibrio indonesiensis]